jgi:hypothetical protein
MTVSPFDGSIWFALTGLSQVARIDPDTFAIQQFSSGGNGSMSVDFDGDGNLYVVHYYSGTVSKMSPSGQVLDTFGAGHLNSPYSYSSDMSGANIASLESIGTWLSNEQQIPALPNTGATGSTILSIEWDQDIAAETELRVEYMVDQDGFWHEAVNGQGVAGTHTVIQFKVYMRSLEAQVSPTLLELRMTYRPW